MTFAQLNLVIAAGVAINAGTILLSALRARRGSRDRVLLLFSSAMLALAAAMTGGSALLAMRNSDTAPAWYVAPPAALLVLSLFMLGRAVVRATHSSPPTD